jgi:hypothetical protein
MGVVERHDLARNTRDRALGASGGPTGPRREHERDVDRPSLARRTPGRSPVGPAREIGHHPWREHASTDGRERTAHTGVGLGGRRRRCVAIEHWGELAKDGTSDPHFIDVELRIAWIEQAHEHTRGGHAQAANERPSMRGLQPEECMDADVLRSRDRATGRRFGRGIACSARPGASIDTQNVTAHGKQGRGIVILAPSVEGRWWWRRSSRGLPEPSRGLARRKGRRDRCNGVSHAFTLPRLGMQRKKAARATVRCGCPARA